VQGRSGTGKNLVHGSISNQMLNQAKVGPKNDYRRAILALERGG